MSFLLNNAIYGPTQVPTVAPANDTIYQLPTSSQLQESDVRMECTKGGPMDRVKPVLKLLSPIQDYLPPSGPYYDYYAIADLFTKPFFMNDARCMSCWMLKHVDSIRECDFRCALCETEDHPGRECHALYVQMKFWKERGHKPPKGVQIRPNASELAYLIVAGIIMPSKKLSDPILPNMDHPIVRQFYKNMEEPKVLKKRERVAIKRGKQVPVANSVANPTSPVTGAHTGSFTPQVDRSSNAVDHEKAKMAQELVELREMLEDKAAKNAYLEAHITATEEALNENARLREKIEQLEEKNTHLEHVQDQIRVLLSNGSVEGEAPGGKRRRCDNDVGGRSD